MADSSPELTPELAADFAAACEAAKADIAECVGRALDQTVELTVGEPATFDTATPPDGLKGPGLGLMLQFQGRGVAFLISKATGVVPEWAANPDPTGKSKLATLAQELAELAKPDSLTSDDSSVGWLPDILLAITKSEPAEQAALIPLELSGEAASGTLWMLMPLLKVDQFIAEAEPAAESPKPEAKAPEKQTEAAPATPATGPATRPKISDYSELPPYSRSLLSISVPITARLAAKKLTVQEIVELGPGAIITFNKPCDGPLDLTVGDQKIAIGEAVKVGEKFGVRVKEMILPGEHFRTIAQKKTVAQKKTG